VSYPVYHLPDSDTKEPQRPTARCISVQRELRHNVLLLRAVESLTAKVLMCLCVLIVAIWATCCQRGEIGPQHVSTKDSRKKYTNNVNNSNEGWAGLYLA
jgi:hypothetical protein